MKQEWTMKNAVVVFVLSACLWTLNGCNETGGTTVTSADLIRQIEPLQVVRAEKDIETITLSQAVLWHEAHEDGTSAEITTPTTQQVPSHICLGVTVGYQAIRYAVDELFPEGMPRVSDFEIKVSGPMDGVWDMINLYTGKDLKFEGQAKAFGLESFVFTARRISQDKTLVFRLRQGFIPEAFFTLKRQGGTCSSAEVKKAKQQALRNILSAEPKDCFQVCH